MPILLRGEAGMVVGLTGCFGHGLFHCPPWMVQREGGGVCMCVAPLDVSRYLERQVTIGRRDACTLSRRD